MKKIGILCLALVIALGSLGVGYAAWTDTLTIEGTVNTGDVDVNVVKYSSTYVFKNLDTDELVNVHTWSRFQPQPSNWLFVASAKAQPVMGQDDQVKITYTNLFPSIDFVADMLLHYEGSIPVKVNASIIDISQGDPELVAMWLLGETTKNDPTRYGAWIDFYWSDADGVPGVQILDDPIGIQLHECDYILVEGHIHLPQDSDLMGKSSSFTATFEVVQWNEYPYTP